MDIPKFILRYSKKAKYLQLRFCKRMGLQVVIPSKSPIEKTAIERFLLDKKNWIEKHTLRWRQLQKTAELPTNITLAALGQVWQVLYQESGAKKLTLTEKGFEIIIKGNVKNRSSSLLLLQKWLKNKARLHLAEELADLSHRTGLAYARLTIRNNQTRFGSCSSKKHISLCCKLLFLPATLVQHVLLHELCHTKHMNHGKLFWKLLNEFDPYAKQHTKELKQKALQIPLWATHKVSS